MREAARAAEADEFIMSPDGYDTQIGERGQKNFQVDSVSVCAGQSHSQATRFLDEALRCR